MADSPHAGRRGPSLRSIGLTVSALLGAAVVVALTIAFLNAGANPTNQRAPQDDFAPDLLNRAAGVGAERMDIQIADENDPTRVVARLLAERVEPDGATRHVTKPEAWIYLDDGQTVRINANNGTFFVPPGQDNPRSGRLVGDVVGRLLPRSAQNPPNPAQPQPVLTARFDEPVLFDLDLARLESAGRVRVSTDALDFTGSDLWVVLNEQQERVERLEIARGERLAYDPSNARPSPQPHTQPADTQPHAERADADETDASEAPVTLYRLTLQDGVRINQAGATVDADRLDLWARLIDNKLALDEDGDRDNEPGARAEAPASPTDPSPDEPAVSPDEPAVITWTGPLVLTPLPEPPPELARDDLAMRLTAERSGAVEFARATEEPDDRPASGRATTVTYYAGSRRVELAAPGGAVELADPDVGRLTDASRVDIALAEGLVHVRGPGGLYDRGHDPASGSPRAIEWTDQADFTFATDTGGMTERVRSAAFSGRVRGQDGASGLRAERLETRFIDDPADSGRAPRLARADLEDASLSDGQGAMLTGLELRIDFDARAGRGAGSADIDPTRVRASGRVRARDAEGARIDAGSLDARLAREISADQAEPGDLVVTRLDASGGVVFDDAEGAAGEAHALSADPLLERVTLTGPAARARTDEAVITGEHIELDGLAGSADVFGAGTFSFAQSRDTADDPFRLDAAWTGSMRHRDRGGWLVCQGEASATAERAEAGGVTRTDTLRADRVELQFEPARGAENGSGGERRLLSASALADGAWRDGAWRDGASSEPASVTTKRRRAPASPGAEGELIELLHLDGPSITLHDAGGFVAATGPGRLLVMDREGDEPGLPDGDSTGVAVLEGGAAQALFEWAGEMTLERSTRRALFTENVRVTHRRLGNGSVATLSCRLLDARFDQDRVGSDEGAGDGLGEGELGVDGRLTLRSAEAIGDVTLFASGKQLRAETLLYDASREVAQARASGSRRVRVFDPARGGSVSADSARWDLRADRIDLVRPGPVFGSP